jgi:hypothetical protein
MVFGISGKSQTGKDTFALMFMHIDACYNSKINPSDIWKLYEEQSMSNYRSTYKVRKFAQKLKEIVALLLNVDISKLENEDFKSTILGEEWWYYKGEVGIYPYDTPYDANKKLPLIKPTPRLLLQEIGTNLFRNQLCPNIWINSTINNIHPKDDIIITDVRFPNEAKAIKDKGGILIRIDRVTSPSRDGNTFVNMRERTHPSELALDDYKGWDYTINNNGTLKELFNNVLKIYECIILKN